MAKTGEVTREAANTSINAMMELVAKVERVRNDLRKLEAKEWEEHRKRIAAGGDSRISASLRALQDRR